MPLAQAEFNQRLSQVKNEVANFPDSKLVAVTKYASNEQIDWALEAGIKDFGENKVQVALEKIEHFSARGYTDIRWHLIGHLQSNKAKYTVGKFSLIHSVDSVKIAKKLSDANITAETVQPVLLQINIAEEDSKYGFLTSEILNDYAELLNLKGISINGLMTMAPYTDDKDILKNTFNGLRQLKITLEDRYDHPLPELSMGMSNDYGHALKLDATIIRLGSVLFGSKV